MFGTAGYTIALYLKEQRRWKRNQLDELGFRYHIHPLAARMIFLTLLAPIADFGLHLLPEAGDHAGHFKGCVMVLSPQVTNVCGNRKGEGKSIQHIRNPSCKNTTTPYGSENYG